VFVNLVWKMVKKPAQRNEELRREVLKLWEEKEGS
jgi:hypothetical protein